ncbi:MAG: hypothetical protein MN733_00030 [Nitrososphaera sp.]|nr:hypothetical protein [Nitrososphaera sp.]
MIHRSITSAPKRKVSPTREEAAIWIQEESTKYGIMRKIYLDGLSPLERLGLEAG